MARKEQVGPNGERRPEDPIACAAKIVRLATGQEREEKASARGEDLIPA